MNITGSSIITNYYTRTLLSINYLETAFCLDLPESFPALPPAMLINQLSLKKKIYINIYFKQKMYFALRSTAFAQARTWGNVKRNINIMKENRIAEKVSAAVATNQINLTKSHLQPRL